MGIWIALIKYSVDIYITRERGFYLIYVYQIIVNVILSVRVGQWLVVHSFFYYQNPYWSLTKNK